MSIIEKLYKSKKYVDGKPVFESDLVDLVKEIELLAEAQDITLSRWETNSRHNSYIKTITYALHEGERPYRSQDLPPNTLMIFLDGSEGTSKKCKAYKELSYLLEILKGI